MITDEQARAAAERIRDDGDDTFASTACYRESSQRDDDMSCLSGFALQELSRREQPDDGMITAEWCEAHGAERISAPRGQMWKVGNLAIFWSYGLVALKGMDCLPITTRRQLLALLTALRGEPSGNPGRPPHVSSAQMNNIGPSH